jgi:hypothetical protein
MFPNVAKIGSGNISREHNWFCPPKCLPHASGVRKEQVVWREGSVVNGANLSAVWDAKARGVSPAYYRFFPFFQSALQRV